MKPIAVIVPDEALLCDVAEQACAQHLFIITNGPRVVLSPVIPEGWKRLVVKIRTPTRATLAAC